MVLNAKVEYNRRRIVSKKAEIKDKKAEICLTMSFGILTEIDFS